MTQRQQHVLSEIQELRDQSALMQVLQHNALAGVDSVRRDTKTFADTLRRLAHETRADIDRSRSLVLSMAAGFKITYIATIPEEREALRLLQERYMRFHRLIEPQFWDNVVRIFGKPRYFKWLDGLLISFFRNPGDCDE